MKEMSRKKDIELVLKGIFHYILYAIRNGVVTECYYESVVENSKRNKYRYNFSFRRLSADADTYVSFRGFVTDAESH